MSNDDFAESWYLAQLKPNCQRIAERNLARQGFRTFLPMQEETTRSRSRFATTTRPLFPGYIFVAFDAAKGGWRAINATHGITRLVSFNNRPQPVPSHIVRQLRQRCDATGRLAPELQPGVGDEVRIATGPFAEFVARVERMAPDRRIWLLLDLMGRVTRIAVTPDALRPVSGP